MKHIWKKTAAFAAAAIMTAALAIPALSAGAADTWADFKDSAKILKEITVTTEDTDATSVAAPYIVYTYAIEPVTSVSATVTDKDDNVAPVKPGVDGLLTIDGDGEIDLTNETVAVSGGEGKLTKEIPVKYSETFPEPGVYRYQITETTNVEKDSVGVVQPAGYASTRYIDVYVNSEGVYGTVMFEQNADVAYNETQKTLGFTDKSAKTESEDADPKDGLADSYPLYNYTVEKVVKNSALPDPKFDFTVSAAGVDGQKFTAEGSDATIASGKYEITKTLGDGGKIELKNLPANIKMTVSEKNTNAATYKVTAEDETAGTLVDGAALAQNGTAGFADKQIATISSGTAAKALGGKTTFTNKQEDISVTGVLFMVAPFVLMLAAGAFFITVIARSRKREAEENII